MLKVILAIQSSKTQFAAGLMASSSETKTASTKGDPGQIKLFYLECFAEIGHLPMVFHLDSALYNPKPGSWKLW